MVEDFARSCRERGLRLFLDVVIGEVARDTILAQSSPSWFYPTTFTLRMSIRDRTRLSTHAAYPRFDDAVTAGEVADWWIARLLRLMAAGASGFRCLEPHRVPRVIWRQIIPELSGTFPIVGFWRGLRD